MVWWGIMSKLIEVWIEKLALGSILHIENEDHQYAFGLGAFKSWGEVCRTLEMAALTIQNREDKAKEPTPCPSHPHSKSDDMGCRACVLGWPAEEERESAHSEGICNTECTYCRDERNQVQSIPESADFSTAQSIAHLRATRPELAGMTDQQIWNRVSDAIEAMNQASIKP